MKQLLLGTGLIITGFSMAVAAMTGDINETQTTRLIDQDLTKVRCTTLQEMSDSELELTAYANGRALIAIDNIGDAYLLDLRERLDAESQRYALDMACSWHRFNPEEYANYT